MIDEGERDKMIIIFNRRNFIESANEIKQRNNPHNCKKKTKHALTGFKPLPLEAVFQTLRWERGKS